ncbi:MAG: ABC transporter permease [Trebonia sp.]
MTPESVGSVESITGETESQPPQEPGRRAPQRRTLRAIGVRTLGIGLFLAVVLVYFTVSTSNFLTLSNVAEILSGAAVLGIVAIGQTGVIISGGFDLSVAGVLPLACVVFVKFSNDGASLPVALIETVAIGAAVGIVNAALIVKAGINPLIVTLASMSVAGGAAYSITNGTTLALTKIANGNLGNLAVGSLPWYLFVFVGLALLAAVIMRFTVFGRIIYALGGSREASILAGIRVNVAVIVVYAASGALAAFAGVVTASQILAGSAGVGSTTALMSVAAVVLGGASLTGGTGGIIGTIGGVLVLGCLSNGLALMQVQSFYVQIITGVALIVAVMFSRLSQVLTR